jgi:hypothetical protein
MNDALKAYMRIGFWILLLSVVLLFFQQPGTAEFVITVCSIGIGAALVGLVVLVNRITS